MKTIDVDVAIIGAGTAGLNARREALTAGASVVLIEGGEHGTTCAREGCMPSKLLIQAADVAHELRHAGRFGIEAGPLRVDDAAVLARVRRERDRFVGFVVEAVDAIPAAQKLAGRARFVGPTRLRVGDDVEVQARAVVIATGSSTWHPNVLSGAGKRLLSNADVFELERLPKSIGVIGAGVIGLEMGQALKRLGVDVALYSLLTNVGPLTDPAVQEEARTTLGEELDLNLGVTVTDVREEEDGVVLRWRDPEGNEHDVRFEALLAATGRRPAVKDLGLKEVGFELAEDGVPFYDPRTMQCGDTPVFIAGDAADHRPVLHEAADDGRIAGRNAAYWPAVRAHVRRTALSVVFSDPQIALVGRTFDELQRSVDFGVGSVSWGDQGRARVMGRNRGLLRVYGDPSRGTLLGAEMVGPRAEHIAHLLAWAVQRNLSVTEALQLPFYHPVLEEGLRTALRDLASNLKLGVPAEPSCLDCPGG